MPVPIRAIALCLCCLILCAASARAEGLIVLRDAETEHALRVFGRPIFEQAGLAPAAVHFVLLQNSELNAFVAGGANIFIHTGLLLATDTPEELAGVIAHETGHIAAGHLLRGRAEISALSTQALLSNILGVAVAVATRSSGAGMAVGSLGNTVTERQFLRHTRAQEGSADNAGVRFLRSARLPLSGFVSFMQKLESQELLPETQQSEYVRTHPLTQDRIDFLVEAQQRFPGGAAPADWPALHARIKAKLSGYLFPDRALIDAADNADARVARAVAWLRKGQTDKALAEIAVVMKAEPDNGYLDELKGQALFEGGRVEEAAAAYARAVEKCPQDALIRLSYAQALLESKANATPARAEALRQLDKAAAQSRNDPEVHRLYAVAYGRGGDEGLSRLHLAEEALLQGNAEFARREAGLAKNALKKGTPSYRRAQDILDATENSKDKDHDKKDPE